MSRTKEHDAPVATASSVEVGKNVELTLEAFTGALLLSLMSASLKHAAQSAEGLVALGGAPKRRAL